MKKPPQKLQKSKETVIVDAMFSGVPIDKNAKEAEETGQIMVAQSRKELTDARSVKFEQVKFSKKMYDALEDKDIELLINVYSGRKSTQDNLLDCGIISEKMSALKGKNYTVKCKLIVGE